MQSASAKYIKALSKIYLKNFKSIFPEIPNQRVTSSPYVTETPSEVAKGMIFRICNYNYEH